LYILGGTKKERNEKKQYETGNAFGMHCRWDCGYGNNENEERRLKMRRIGKEEMGVKRKFSFFSKGFFRGKKKLRR
jgi:hypothetical protein